MMGMNPHPGQNRRSRLAGLAAFVTMLPAGAPPLRAQSAPSGSLSVQMRVTDALTEETPARGRTASLAKAPGGGGGGGGGGSCTITRNTNVDFGVQTIRAGNTIPPAIGGAFMTMICNANTFPAASGTAPVDVSVFHGASAAVPPLYMTLGGLPAASGVEYRLCADDVCQSPFTGNSGTVEALILDPGPPKQSVNVGFYAQLIGPFPSGAPLAAGTYSDTLTVFVTF